MKRYASTALSGPVLKALPLTPLEGFVLSRVDADCTEDDIVMGTGLGEEVVRSALDLLMKLGAIQVFGSSSLMPAARPSGAHPAKPTLAELHAAAPSQISAEERTLLDCLEARLLLANHYVLLGVPIGAERRAIKDAYYELVASLHPDRFFGRSLGADGDTITRLFAAIEDAHFTLSHVERRAHYDASLDEGDEPATNPRAVATSSGSTRTRPVVVAERASAPALDDASPSERITDVLDAASGRITDVSGPPSGLTLARKLGRNAGSAPALSGSPPSSPPPALWAPGSAPNEEATAQAIADLRRRYEGIIPLAKAEKVRTLVLQGEASLAASQGAEALQFFRLAQGLEPESADVIRGLAKAESLGGSEVGKHYTYFAKRAEYANHPAEALTFWEEAAQRAPDDAVVQGDAAAAILRMEEAAGIVDGSAALRCASRAVLLDPKNAAFRALLGRAYLRQGMLRNAEREAASAAAIDAECSELTELRRELTSRSPLR